MLEKVTQKTRSPTTTCHWHHRENLFQRFPPDVIPAEVQRAVPDREEDQQPVETAVDLVIALGLS